MSTGKQQRQDNCVRRPSLDEAIRELEYRLTQKTFIKAVSPSIAKLIRTVIDYAKSAEKNVNEALKLIEDLLLSLYNVERSVKEVVKSLIRVITQEYKVDLLEVYPYLPSNTKRLIEKFLQESEVGSLERAYIQVDSEIEILFNKVYDLARKLRELLQELSGMYISK